MSHITSTSVHSLLPSDPPFLSSRDQIPSKTFFRITTDNRASEPSQSCGTCISFNPETNDLFLIGNENGLIQKYSNLSTAQYLETYKDHENVVYNVQWNPHHSRVFLSCSADWTIRIWDHSLKQSVFIFDLLNEVKDVTWAPFSSSLFAAVTNDGKVHVFDILLNRQQ
ncbi:Dynein intermediate chain 1, axonemal, partial [Stegodyphus mimosarum]